MRRMEKAGFWRRFGAAFIDALVVDVVTYILVLVIGNGGAAIGVLGGIGYYVWFHGSTGQTPGDAALGIRVVDTETGRPIGFSRAFIRWLVSLVSGFVLLLGYLWMLWDSNKQCWHDKAARNYVVRV